MKIILSFYLGRVIKTYCYNLGLTPKQFEILHVGNEEDAIVRTIVLSTAHQHREPINAYVN
jgi:hypothetical protein